MKDPFTAITKTFAAIISENELLKNECKQKTKQCKDMQELIRKQTETTKKAQLDLLERDEKMKRLQESLKKIKKPIELREDQNGMSRSWDP